MYNKFSQNNICVDFERSHGAWVYDSNTNLMYLDLHNSYSSMALGYKQYYLGGGLLTKNLSVREYSSIEHNELLGFFEENMLNEKYTTYHLAPNGGAAVEKALKVAMEHTDAKRILTLHGSFHGVTGMSALATSIHFGKRVEFLDRSNVVELPVNISKKEIKEFFDNEWLGGVGWGNDFACCIIEPIQCSFGDRELEWEFLEDLREICREKNIPFIVDEVQTGYYATGDKFYAAEDFDADIIVFGKKAQMSGILICGELETSFDRINSLIGITHDVDISDLARFKLITEFIAAKKEKGEFFRNGMFNDIYALNQEDFLKDVRVNGFLWAFEFHDGVECLNFVEYLRQNNILVNRTTTNIIRMRPSFVFIEEDMRFFIRVVKNYENRHNS
jgi:L-lysine 6-transaminase